ncbi:fimbrial biogenesis usher protein [Klebsiella sp. CN_Kp098]|uniref:fimbrial biogenesis usher protein n=1 Tax=unclassified Klebsiella TaxID=2608929 RepID=UPI0032B37B62
MNNIRQVQGSQEWCHCAAQALRAALSPVALGVCLSLMQKPALAGVYFNPAFLSDDPSAVADLSRFEKGGAQPPGTYQVDIYVNQDMYKTRKLNFVVTKDEKPAALPAGMKALSGEDVDDNGQPAPKSDDTGLKPVLTVGDLKEMGVNVALIPSLKKAPDTQAVDLVATVPGSSTNFDFSQQRLTLNIPQAYLSNHARGYISPDKWDQGIPAILLNYNFSGSNNRGDSASDDYFLSLNSGVNLGGWRLRDNSTWSYMRSDGMAADSEWQHISTYVTHTVEPLKSEFVVGDVSTPSDVFDSLPMRGIMLSSDDNMLPDSQRGFAPTVRGIARSSSKVTISQNGYTVYQTYVPAGPFAINDLYSMSSSGDLQVTVTGSDGSTQSYTVPFASVPILQREGRVKYALAAGKYRSGEGDQNDVNFGQGTLIWGLRHGITAFGGVQISDNYQAEAAGLGFRIGDFGAVSLDATQANSTLADGSQHSGQSYRAMWAKSLEQTGTNLQLATTRFSTRGFYTLDQTSYKIMKGYDVPQTDDVPHLTDTPTADYTDYYNLYNTQKNQVTASISQNLGENGKYGSLYLTGTWTSYWNTSDSDSSWQGGYNSNWKNISYSLNYSYTKNAGETGPADQQFSVSFSVPLGQWLSPSTDAGGDITKVNSNTAEATYSMNTDNNGYTSNQVGVSGTLLKNNNLSYSVTEGMQNHGGGNNGSASLNYQGTYGNSNVAYNYSPGYKSVNYGLSGGVVIHQHGVTLSQPLGNSNILVAAPGADNVSVANTTGVSTDWRGYAVVPYANTYHENDVSLDSSDLPANVDLDGSVKKVVPTEGALVEADFNAHIGLRALLTLMHDGKPLPFGATASQKGTDNSGIVGDNGQVYLSGLTPTGSVTVQWGNGPQDKCTAPYRLPVPKDLKKVQVLNATAVCR